MNLKIEIKYGKVTLQTIERTLDPACFDPHVLTIHIDEPVNDVILPGFVAAAHVKKAITETPNDENHH